MTRLRRGLLWACVATVACAGESAQGPAPLFILASGGDHQIGAAGQALAAPLEVTVTDRSGNPLTGITVTWTAGSDGSVDPAASVTDRRGTATTVRTLGANAGPQTTIARTPDGARAEFAHVAQVQGATAIAASGIAVRADSVRSTVPFTAVVRDQDGRPVAGVVVTWSAAGGGTLDRTQDTTDAAGLTTVALTLSSTATRQTALAAVAGLMGSPAAFSDDALPGDPASVTALAGGFQVAPAGTTLPLPHSLLVRDAYGNPKGGVSVRWVAGEGGGLIDAAAEVTAVTGGNGIAAVTRTLGSAVGPQRDTAIVQGLAGSPAIFTDTAAALVTIQVGNDFFRPQIDTVAVGAFLTFVWVSGGNLHNVVWDEGDPAPVPTDSPNESALNATYRTRITGLGTYGYHCSYHGGPGTGVFGVIVTR